MANEAIEMIRGDTLILDVVLTDVNDDPFDLTGCTIWFTAKENASDLDIAALFQVSTVSGTTSSGPA